jgi:predicted GIY-YIG superfamily endonuclease/N-acetylglutamate synthase-like GNAT family acetyltransferase
MSFIYVLHFDEKLSHAQHYVGCTDNLKARLLAHATGAGSRICRELMNRGINWRLGGLFETSHRNMRKLERGLKDQRHASRYCQVCNVNNARFSGTKNYDIGNVAFPATREALAAIATPRTGQNVRHTTENEPKSTMQAILHLMRRDKDALGFVPAGGDQGLEMLVPRGLIVVAEAGGQVVGYASHTLNPSKTRCTIHQCCVQDDARFMHLGTKMVDQIKASYTVDEVIAKVRIDLAANHFWNAIGFDVIDTVVHPTSKNLINHYRLDTTKENGLWLPTNMNNHEPTKSQTTEKESNSLISSQES